MNDKLPTKTVKFMSLENLYVYSTSYSSYSLYFKLQVEFKDWPQHVTYILCHCSMPYSIPKWRAQ